MTLALGKGGVIMMLIVMSFLSIITYLPQAVHIILLEAKSLWTHTGHTDDHVSEPSKGIRGFPITPIFEYEFFRNEFYMQKIKQRQAPLCHMYFDFKNYV